MSLRIVVGIDDTDVAGSRGTNQLARALVAQLADCCDCLCILRHQLLDDPRVPCTTKNGSASITLQLRNNASPALIAERLRRQMLDEFIPGSDPGLCFAETAPASVIRFGLRCKCELVTQDEAHQLAQENGIFLKGLGGSDDGVIGALAAVGLEATRDDGRIVQLGRWPDDLSGFQPLGLLHQRGLRVRMNDTGEPIHTGTVDVGKHLRPNRRDGQDVLFVERVDETNNRNSFIAVRLP